MFILISCERYDIPKKITVEFNPYKKILKINDEVNLNLNLNNKEIFKNIGLKYEKHSSSEYIYYDIKKYPLIEIGYNKNKKKFTKIAFNIKFKFPEYQGAIIEKIITPDLIITPNLSIDELLKYFKSKNIKYKQNTFPGNGGAFVFVDDYYLNFFNFSFMPSYLGQVDVNLE